MRTKSATLFTLAAASAGPVGALAGGAAPATASTAQVSANTAAATAKLPVGLYVDARDGTPHYVLSLSASGHDGIKGSANFIYQDGRADFTGIFHRNI